MSTRARDLLRKTGSPVLLFTRRRSSLSLTSSWFALTCSGVGATQVLVPSMDMVRRGAAFRGRGCLGGARRRER
jgi:NADH:ubiquinone oxidoreductase subunit B-like Fe-S oxidoreductase